MEDRYHGRSFGVIAIDNGGEWDDEFKEYFLTSVFVPANFCVNTAGPED